MYTIESLTKINPQYNGIYPISQDDVERINNLVSAIESGRTDYQIQSGDMVEFTTRHGNYYENAHIDTFDINEWSICEKPFLPFVYLADGSAKCITGGGEWTTVPHKLKLIGKRKKSFKDLGTCGAYPNGAIIFEANVNVWEYKEPFPYYKNYTTKDWRMNCFTCIDDSLKTPKAVDFRYVDFGKCLTFENNTEYGAWLKTYKGVEFKVPCDNQIVVFSYNENCHLIRFEEWISLDLPMDTRMCNGVNLCKVKYDDASHMIEEYRFDNAGTLDQRRYKPYELARGRYSLPEEMKKFIADYKKKSSAPI